MTNLYKKATAVATTLLLSLFLLPACSDNEGGGPDIPDARFAKVVIALHPLDNSRPTQTKAETIKDEDDSNYEHYIKNYRILILRKEADDAYKVVHNIAGGAGNNAHPNSETTQEVELEIGQTYKFYAFANLDGLADGGDYINNLGEGDKLDLAHAVTLKPMSDYNETGDIKIPMSSYGEEVTIQENNAAVSLQLIRLIGKVSVSIENGTDQPINVTGLKLENFRTGGTVYLLPYDAAQGRDTKLLEATGTMTETYGPAFPGETTETSSTGTFTAKELSLVITNLASGNTHYVSPFYANETRFTSANASKPLLITTTVKDRDLEPQKPTMFNFIRRNDWLYIPLLISDAETTISIEQQRMPIGGLPYQYIFEPGVVVSSMEFKTDHGGDITIQYAVEVTGGNSLKYYLGGNAPLTEKYSSAVLESQTNNLLINVPEADKDGGWQPNAIEFKMDKGDTDLSGSFKVTAQELNYLGTATIKLTLVVTGTKNSDSFEITLPYTITITNGKPAKTEGGNS